MVYQNYHLFPHLSPRENIAYGLRYLRLSKAARDERLEQVVEALSIGYLLGRRSIEGLSGGEMQKVALARALVIEPRVLLLDEPLGPLDYPSRESVFDILREVRESFDIPVLHVTHDYTEALVLADKIAVLFDGRIVQVGSGREVFWRPGTREVARFLGIPNLVPAHFEPAEDGTCWATLGRQRLRTACCQPGAGGPGWICIRPEDIAPVVDTQGHNVLHGRLVDLSDRGFSLKAGIDLDGVHLACTLSHHQLNALRWQVGGEVAVTISPERVHVLEERP
jgi:ABC-type Fe3+/spermidine/putrescine transport system ATPase subunit